MMDTPSPCEAAIAATIGVNIHLMKRTNMHGSERLVRDRNTAMTALDPSTNRTHR
jgi:hypothetical protein